MPLSRGVRGLVETWPAPLSRTCQWKLAPNSTPVVGLDDLDPERQPRQHIVQELDGALLVELGVDTQHAQAGAVVDGGELVVLAPGSWERAMNLTSSWTRWPGRGLLIAAPAAVVALVALGGGQPVQARMRHMPEGLSCTWW